MCFGNQNFLRKKKDFQNQTRHTIPGISDALIHERLYDHSKCEMSPCIPVALVALKPAHVYFVDLVGGTEIPDWLLIPLL